MSEDKNFYDDLLGDKQEMNIEYVTIPGVGRPADYTGFDVKGKIALVRRGDTTFEEKANTAQEMGAAGIIIYNNVSGDIKMNAGELPWRPSARTMVRCSPPPERERWSLSDPRLPARSCLTSRLGAPRPICR